MKNLTGERKASGNRKISQTLDAQVIDGLCHPALFFSLTGVSCWIIIEGTGAKRYAHQKVQN
jgi:hypothetical protein